MPPAHSPRLVKRDWLNMSRIPLPIHYCLPACVVSVSGSTFPNLVAIRIGSTLTNCAIDMPFRRACSSNVFQEPVLARALVVPSCKTGIG